MSPCLVHSLCDVGCTIETWDVVFALDDSSGVSADCWSAMLSLINSYVDQFRVDYGGMRIGVVRYSNVANLVFDLEMYRTAPQVKAAVSQIPREARYSQRNLADAFQFTLSYLLIRRQRHFADRVRDVSITACANNNKKLSYCWETVRRESMPIAEMDVEMTI